MAHLFASHRRPDSRVLLVVFVLVAVLLSLALVFLDLPDILLFLLAGPVLIASYNQPRWVYLGALALLTALALAVTSRFPAHFSTSAMTIGVSAITIAIASEALHYLAVARMASDNERNRALEALAQQEAALRDSEERYRTALYGIGDGVIATDVDGCVWQMNPVAEALTGWTEATARGKPVEEVFRIVNETTRLLVESPVRRVCREGTVVDLANHTLLIARDGTERPIADSGAPIRNSQGQISGVVLVFRDRTKERAAEKALSDSEAFFHHFFDYLSAGAVVYEVHDEGTDFIVKDINRSGQSLRNVTRDEVAGRNALDVFPGLKELGLVQVLQDVWQTGIPCQQPASLYRDDRITAWIEETIFRLPSGEIVALFDDVTDRKRAEEERVRLMQQIEERSHQLQQIITTVPEGVALLDAGLHVLVANPAAEAILDVLSPAASGSSQPEPTGRQVSDSLIHGSARLWREVMFDDRIFEIAARPLADETDAAGWVMVLREVTEEHRMRQQASQQERLAAVGQLAAGIAHDFNNILSVILLHAGMTLNSPGLPPRLAERLVTVSRQAEQAADLVKQILDFSRQAVLARRSLDLLPFLKEQIRLLERTLPENIGITLVANGEKYGVNADPTRIQQVVMNLALNARDAMPTGGVLRFELAHASTLPPDLRSPTSGDAGIPDWIRLSVTDSGMGIDSGALPHVFEPFFTTKGQGKGSGLGLAQVHGIVRQHGGEITVETRAGAGTTFAIYLPAVADEKPGEPPGMPDTVATGEGQLLLVVEDNAALREALVDLVELLGYRTLAAANGHEALAMIEQHPDIALIMSDLVMPAMGGEVLLQSLRQRGFALPVIILSGHPLDSDLDNLSPLGLAGWLLKPPRSDELSALIRRALQGIQQ